jgi:hypothetical protein
VSPLSPPIQTADADTDYPGRMLGVIGLIVAIVANPVGLIISAIAFSQSKKAGYQNTPAQFGIIIGGILFIMTIALVAIGLAGASFYASF